MKGAYGDISAAAARNVSQSAQRRLCITSQNRRCGVARAAHAAEEQRSPLDNARVACVAPWRVLNARVTRR